MEFKRITSVFEKEILIADDADVIGDVTIGEKSSIWYHATIRAELCTVSIGRETNIQDGVVVHTDPGFPVSIGDRVTVGHNAIIHGSTVGDETLIGMGAILLNGSVVGKQCVIGAGALVTQGTVIPDGNMAFGSPAKLFRPLTEDERGKIGISAKEYVDLAKKHFG